MLVARDIHKTYTLGKTTVPVLRGLSLTVEKAESIAVVGVSGAGKSTLLHVLGGLDKPDDGSVAFESEAIYKVSARRRTRIRAEKIGFVFQSYHLLPEMDVLHNVMLSGMALHGGGPNSRLRARAMELIEAVELGDRVRHRPMELSGGEQQRVALARALMNDPNLVLADEPTGNLDEGTGAHVLEHLFALSNKAGHALVIVTHDTHIAQKCDRMLKLTDGVLSEA
jgi:ABC-type lipoprotein export system ATPase subunit